MRAHIAVGSLTPRQGQHYFSKSLCVLVGVDVVLSYSEFVVEAWKAFVSLPNSSRPRCCMMSSKTSAQLCALITVREIIVSAHRKKCRNVAVLM
jgi:hypothetical protein